MAKAKEVMHTCVVTVGEDEDIYEAIRMMALNNVTGLPVVDEDGILAGMITEKDVLGLVDDTEQAPRRVADLMATDVVSFHPEDDIKDIADCLRRSHFRRVPILDGGRLVGIISRRDIIRYIQDLKHADDVLRDNILEVLY